MSQSAAGFRARTLGADIDSDVGSARAAYCAERAREHRQAANAYTTLRNVLWGTTLAGAGTTAASALTAAVSDGKDDGLKTAAIIGGSTAVVAFLGALMAGGQASERNERADASVRGATTLLAAAEARRQADAAPQDDEAEAERLLSDPGELEGSTALENFRKAYEHHRNTVQEEGSKRRAWQDARLPDGRATGDSRKALDDAEKATLRALTARDEARSKLLREKRVLASKSADGSPKESLPSAADEKTAFEQCLAGAAGAVK
ncbi:MAG TPA: hypothetical protein VMG12_29335 [Polyangiaceae bacterium]|nr:hypothetical protein [Polyangiaceae bacterium]